MTEENITLNKLKKHELIQICKERRIKGYSTFNKSQIIHLIQNFKEEVSVLFCIIRMCTSLSST